MKSGSYFITAIGTDIGKTFLVENICRILREKNQQVEAIKPVISGFRDDDVNSDLAKILKSLGRNLTERSFDKISPWRFKEPISPNFAASFEKREIKFLDVVDFCQKEISDAKNNNYLLLIEGAGGVMTPISDNESFLDLIAYLKIPTLLISANYLGAISHTLCAVEALKSRNIIPEKIIVNNHNENSLTDMAQVTLAIENFSKIKTVSINDFFKSFLD